ncbi:MAG: ParA family protein [Acidimicrobiales bacterium]
MLPYNCHTRARFLRYGTGGVLDNVLLVTNGKGGVGKTSLVANLTGLAATAGWSVLAADLDPQGNLARDLGYPPRPTTPASTGSAGSSPSSSWRARRTPASRCSASCSPSW